MITITPSEALYAAGVILAVFVFLVLLGFAMGSRRAPSISQPAPPPSPREVEPYIEDDAGYIEDHIYDPDEGDIRVPTVR